MQLVPEFAPSVVDVGAAFEREQRSAGVVRDSIAAEEARPSSVIEVQAIKAHAIRLVASTRWCFSLAVITQA
jgi:hypothetical protein